MCALPRGKERYKGVRFRCLEKCARADIAFHCACIRLYVRLRHREI